MSEKELYAIEKAIGLKKLTPTWAKAEIFIGLGCVWGALYLISAGRSETISFFLFVLGGYLAMAGSRSHLYMSSNILAEFLWREIEKSRQQK
jgi:hypothetical protein